jgi:hypothetical protein
VLGQQPYDSDVLPFGEVVGVVGHHALYAAKPSAAERRVHPINIHPGAAQVSLVRDLFHQIHS